MIEIKLLHAKEVKKEQLLDLKDKRGQEREILR
jgi:hypothetical protein